MSYQHDLIIKSGSLVKIIGSVKTSSKDRLDKIFMDKFLLAKLTGKDVPHVAIFLNDVQRKGKNPKRIWGQRDFPARTLQGIHCQTESAGRRLLFRHPPNMRTENILKDTFGPSTTFYLATCGPCSTELPWWQK